MHVGCMHCRSDLQREEEGCGGCTAKVAEEGDQNVITAVCDCLKRRDPDVSWAALDALPRLQRRATKPDHWSMRPSRRSRWVATM